MNNLADKASRLFQYLADLQARREKVVKKINQYGEESQWLTLQSLREITSTTPLKVSFNSSLFEAEHEENNADSGTDDFLIRVERPAPPRALTLPEELQEIIQGHTDNPAKRPELDLSAVAEDARSSELKAKAEAWLLKWDDWAAATRALSIYQDFFDMQVKANQQSDEYELVFGAGWLSWALEGKDAIDRPIFMLNTEISMDKSTGDIVIRETGDPIRAELEVLSASHMDDGRFVEDLKAFLEQYEGQLTDADDFEELAQYTVNGLSTEARYEEAREPVKSDGRAVLSWAPIILLHPRQRVGLSSTFRLISQLVEEQGNIPAGLRPLVDPGFEAEVVPSGRPGAMFHIGGDLYSPLPLNEKQKRVLEHVDSHAHTIVQGPPGTGKTHMAAALLSHLLAQGKRVLVTAAKERALYELRDKLPAEIRELAVSVIGSSSQEMAELRTAIETIQRQSSNFDERDAARRVSALERELDLLREKRTRVLREWAAQLEAEQRLFNIEGYEMPLPQVIQKVERDREDYSWIEEVGYIDPTRNFPLDVDQVNQLLEYLDDPAFASREPYTGAAVLDPARFVSSTELLKAINELEEAERQNASAHSAVDPAFLKSWETLSPADRKLVESTVTEVAGLRGKIETFPSAWFEAVSPEMNRHDFEVWETNTRSVLESFEPLSEALQLLDDIQRISVDKEFDAYVPQAQSIRQYLSSGKTLNVRPDGTVKPSLFGGGAVKAAMPFLEGVRINGLPPTTPELVEKYLTYVSTVWELQSMQKLWPLANLDISEPARSARAFRDDVKNFSKYLETVRRITSDVATLNQRGFDVSFAGIGSLEPQLAGLKRIDETIRAVADAERMFTQASGLNTIRQYRGPRHAWIEKAEAAILGRDVSAYEAAIAGGLEFHRLGLERQRFLDMLSSLREWSKGLADNVEDPSKRGVWGPRLRDAKAARNWLLACQRVESSTSQQRVDSQDELEHIDREVREALSKLAADRAWSEAAGSSRIDGEMRATMQAYVQAVRRLGKGTGTYADQKRRDVRRHLGRAREAVPVWIMPIYKVIEQFELKQNMFDVVIIDEASQAGMEAIFLQYLAPKVVVIGDDKQVSPDAVGVRVDELQKLARQYLYDFDAIDAWVDPKRSLFDDANMRYGGRIALEEHRRCVPEIIEFSNELVYRPNNIELKPVREPVSDRLAPFRITRTPNAFQSDKGKVNRVEADVLVDRLLTVLEDPNYDGKSIGVISLLSSSGQADYIQNRLLTAVPPHIWEERDLKVGDPAEFQGAERDVVFLSMVAAIPQQGSLGVLTQPQHEQRYNVAVSRAKDQVWLFHSIGIEDISNHDCMRYKLLEYAYRVAEASPEKRISQLVSWDDRVEPFDSLFEQRVYNELVRRGYFVIPQFDAFGRRIDLVVQGQGGRLAVECDGDFWHSEEHAIADQSRQRELERLGWTFVRLFESDFYLDPQEQIQRIVDRAEELGIEPGYVEGADLATTTNIEVVESLTEITENVIEPEPMAPDPVTVVPPAPLLQDDNTNEVPAEATAPEKLEVSAPPVTLLEVSQALEDYVEFTGSTASVYEYGAAMIDQGITEIIEVEGPIPEELLFQRYVKASGGQKVRSTARSVLGAGLKRLIKRQIVLQVTGSERIYKMPGQPDVRPRARGSRDAYQISDAEWAAHLRAVMAEKRFTTEEELFRAARSRVGFGRSSRKMTDHIARIFDEMGNS